MSWVAGMLIEREREGILDYCPWLQVRRAYKKSALQLHPDKALAQCRFSDRLGQHGVQLLDTPQVLLQVRP